MITKDYRRIEVNAPGGPEVLEMKSVPLLPLGPGEVCVRVLAAGVSYGDVLNRVGLIPGSAKHGSVPGYDITGIVESIGDGVSKIRPGQCVTGLLHSGGYSEFATVPAGRLIPVPDGVEPIEVAASVLNYYVAFQMLHRVAHVKSGQIILAHGAAGGVGIALLQLGQLSSLRCYGTCSPSKFDAVGKLGGRPIDYKNQDFVAAIRGAEPDGIDVVFDPIGGSSFRRSYRLLRRGGTLIGFGQSAAYHDGRVYRREALSGLLGLMLPKLIPDGKRTVFYTAWSIERRSKETYWQDLGEVLRLLANREIRPIIAETLPLVEAAKAHALLEQRALVGKIVLTM